MDFDFTKLEEYGLAIEDGFGYTGGKDKYLAAIQRYLKGYENNRKDLAGMAEAGDVEGFKIKVHSLKSNSKMIGARSLSGKFEELEMAAKREDEEFIRSSIAAALEEYDNLVASLAPIGAMVEVHPADELSAEEAKKTADELLTALDEFDDDLSGRLARKLSGYPFRITQKEKLKSAMRFINDFMYDEAAELISEIYPTIE